jgi:hypothetical protein
VKAKYEKEKKDGRDHGSIRRLTFEECAGFILELAADHPVTIVIDALDECREISLRSSQGSLTDRQDLLKRLREMIDAKPGNIKVFLSSRGDEDISRRLHPYPTIVLNASKNGADIRSFIESEVDKLIEKRSDFQNLREDIIEAVDKRAGGMLVLITRLAAYV